MTLQTAIILASGLSRRFRGYKLLVTIDGLKLVEYPIIALSSAGIRRLIVVANSMYAKDLTNIALNYMDEVIVSINNEPERENGYSLYIGLKECTSDRVIVSVADHLYPPQVLYRLSYGCKEAYLCVSGERIPSTVNEDEATKILADSDGTIVSIGKALSSYNYIDMGVFVMDRKRVLEAIEAMVGRQLEIKLSDIVQKLALMKKAKVVDCTGIPWADVDTYEEYEALITVRRDLLSRIKRWILYEGLVGA